MVTLNTTHLTSFSWAQHKQHIKWSHLLSKVQQFIWQTTSKYPVLHSTPTLPCGSRLNVFVSQFSISHATCDVPNTCMAATKATIFVSSWLDYANSVSYTSPSMWLPHLQYVQNSLARVVTCNTADITILVSYNSTTSLSSCIVAHKV